MACVRFMCIFKRCQHLKPTLKIQPISRRNNTSVINTSRRNLIKRKWALDFFILKFLNIWQMWNAPTKILTLKKTFFFPADRIVMTINDQHPNRNVRLRFLTLLDHSLFWKKRYYTVNGL